MLPLKKHKANRTKLLHIDTQIATPQVFGGQGFNTVFCGKRGLFEAAIIKAAESPKEDQFLKKVSHFTGQLSCKSSPCFLVKIFTKYPPVREEFLRKTNVTRWDPFSQKSRVFAYCCGPVTNFR